MTTTTKKPDTAPSRRVFVHPYRGGSRSAKALADALGGRRILVNGKSRYKSRSSDVVINWGSSKRYVDDDVAMLNDPDNVAIASNKLTFFQTVSKRSVGVCLVPFTESVDVVNEWLDDGNIVCARTKLTGHSADGLVLVGPRDSEKELDIPSAKLYTKYVPKALEYRVHVFNGEVIRIQKKILRPELSARIKDESDDFDTTSVDWKVRNHDNGFVYVTNDVEKDMPKTVASQAIACVRACGLMFGAVDVIFNAKKNAAFVLEVNTSPGLEGGTIEAYTKAAQKFIESGAEVVKGRLLGGNPYVGIDFSKIASRARVSCAKAVLDGMKHHVTNLGSWSDMTIRLRKQNSNLLLSRSSGNFSAAADGPERYPEEWAEVQLFCEALIAYYGE